MENEFGDCDTLLKHLSLYVENWLDVDRLIAASVRCGELQHQIEGLEQECSRQKEKFQVLQADNFVRVNQLSDQLKKLNDEKADLEWQMTTNDQKISTLRRDFKLKEQEYNSRTNELKSRIVEQSVLLEQAKKSLFFLHLFLWKFPYFG